MAKSVKKTVSLKEYARRRKLWLDALESGRFKQTTGTLTLLDGIKKSHCCLGVACVVAAKDIKIVKKTCGQWVDYDEEGSTMPSSVMDYFGFRTNDGTFSKAIKVPVNTAHIVANEAYGLVELNDTRKMSFKQIAEIVKKNPAKLWRKGTYKPKVKKATKK